MIRGDNTVIVKRNARSGAKEKARGAWKVAFADFTLAMMAFFMVMWILEVSNEKERREIAGYFRSMTLFEGSPFPFNRDNSPFPVDLGGTPSVLDQVDQRIPPDNPRAGISEFMSVPDGTSSQRTGWGDSLATIVDGQFDSPEELRLLMQAFEAVALEHLAQNHLQVDMVPSGLRVVIRDHENQQMFRRGEGRMTPFFEDLLLSLGGVLLRIENKLIISGHTDITPYSTSSYSNWELSGDRALQARQVMVAGGMPPSQVAQVTAFAETRLINEEDKESSDNRRIELLILTSRAESELNNLFSPGTAESVIDEAAERARFNQPVNSSDIQGN
jgi:chemotaxis protein MotB